MSERLHYGNWIRWKVLSFLGLGTLGFGLLGLFPFPAYVRVAAELVSITFFASLFYPLILYFAFSPYGGNLQDDLYHLIVEMLGAGLEGQVLDIGAGNGILAIRVAQRHPSVHATGMDVWGRNWEYSRSICAANARIAQVADRIRFVKGDAARLDFEDASFGAVVSNLTFHEVRSATQKREVVREALRVLNPGGRFVLVDYFYAAKYYGEPADFEGFLASLGLEQVRLQPLSELMAFPRFLQHPKALGRVGMLTGVK